MSESYKLLDRVERRLIGHGIRFPSGEGSRARNVCSPSRSMLEHQSKTAKHPGVGYGWKIPSREDKQLTQVKVIQRSQVYRFREGREDRGFVAMASALGKEDLETHRPGIWYSTISRDPISVDSINFRSKIFGQITSVLSRYIIIIIF